MSEIIWGKICVQKVNDHKERLVEFLHRKNLILNTDLDSVCLVRYCSFVSFL